MTMITLAEARHITLWSDHIEKNTDAILDLTDPITRPSAFSIFTDAEGIILHWVWDVVHYNH